MPPGAAQRTDHDPIAPGRSMIEPAQSASRSALTVLQPRSPSHRWAPPHDAIPSASGPLPPGPSAARPPPDDPEVMVLSSADFLACAPLSGRGSASRGRGTAAVGGAAAGAVADPLIGMVLADRYRILEPIGRGGM